VQQNAGFARIQYAQDVPEYDALNAALFVVRRVLTKVCVQTVNKKRRIKMKNKETKIQEQAKTLSQSSLRQAAQKSSLRAEKQKPVLRFSPTAWAKLLYFRDKSDNEFGGLALRE